MKTRFYVEGKGDVVTQIYEVEAIDWENAKKAAFHQMSPGDWQLIRGDKVEK